MFSFRLWMLGVICLAVSVKARHNHYECPEPEDIYPCYCEDDEDDSPILHCTNLHTPEQIQKAMRGLKGYKMFKISFFLNWILDPVKPDVFQDVYVERILFENSTINLTPPQFQGLENHLKSIEFTAAFNKTNPIGTLSLGHLKNLHTMILHKNDVETLPNSWLTSVPDSLTSLFFEDNNIVTLEDKVFSKVKRLFYMVLDSNELSSLSRSMFPDPANKLYHLSLNHNKLSHLPDDLFDNMPSLRVVEMNNNRLTTLEDNVWKNVFSQLKTLDLSENPLQCDSSLEWIFEGVREPSSFYAKCAEPERLRGKWIQHLGKEDIKLVDEVLDEKK